MIKRQYVTLGSAHTYKGFLYEASWRINAKDDNSYSVKDFLEEILEFASNDE